jgi:hypothetical protein
VTVDCPACGLSNEETVVECSRCHLAVGLFPSVRESVGATGSDPNYVRIVNEMLDAVDDGASSDAPGAWTGLVQGRLLQPNRFPAIGAPEAREAGTRKPLDALPSLPALPAGAGFELYRHQVDDYLQLGRRQGIDFTEFSDRAKRAILVQDRESVEALSRELFVFLAASIAEEYDAVCAKRNELAALVPTATPDAELDGCKSSLLMGDLAGAQRRLRRVSESLSDLEDHWATVQILLTEADLLAETIRELGGDPTPALGPLNEGRRLARDGRREEAEPILARATFALWSVLTPLFSRELARTREMLLKCRAEGGDVAVPVATIRELAQHLRQRNFATGVLSFRRLRDSVEALGVATPTESPPAATSEPGDEPPAGSGL